MIKQKSFTQKDYMNIK